MARITAALGPDAIGILLRDFILQTESSLDMAVWEMGMSYGHLLLSPELAAVRKRVLLDSRAEATATTAAKLRDAVELRIFAASGCEAHWKMLLRDGRDLAVGSGNLTLLEAPQLPLHAGAAVGTREWWILMEDVPALVGQYTAAWDDAWSRAGPEPQPAVAAFPPPLVHPLTVLQAPLSLEIDAACVHALAGGAAIAAWLLAAMQKARRRIWVLQPYVHGGVAAVRPLLQAMEMAQARGADCRLLLGLPRAESWGLPTGLNLRVMNAATYTAGHAKGAVIDDAVLAGSANWSEAGLGANPEAAAAVAAEPVAAYFAAAFGRDWEASDPAAGS